MIWEVSLFALVGFAAQLVDGAVGMAYGLSATTALLSLGVTPVTASASVHAAEIFTTGASGYAHWRLGNVRRDLVVRLAVPGVVGGMIGAYVLTGMPTGTMQVVVSVYLLGLGALILHKAAWPRPPVAMPDWQVRVLGFFGGIVDAMGGGGWGPIVTSTLLGKGDAPREAIGSANLAEFFVTTAVTATFVFTVGLSLWPVIAGLVLGGVLAAPFAALVVRHLSPRRLLLLVGVVVSLLALRNLLAALGTLGATG
ncbi:sulfite exporter TauE/SafE family protein [Sabulicella glaciei]|uniref:Probable membrane transporter protein n=1 Tax=Sabulicella glaciei TaxID=2984948 RepID=A0ABT3NV92_9PROT|nr:sulfite exporter TauE/SafE family protein [Roseococcus sp. MDT2-1-1]MCW8085823.1 sulfite exporter TauE/SafE family protein [Roseococcus sp. MDT2-1-1]